ncbi:MAG: MFS transporter [Sandaracinobacteroides sp.]
MRIKLGSLLAWSGIGLPVAALGLPLVVYLPPHYAGTLGLPLATVGFIFALVRIVDIPIDPLLGALMDNGRSRWGQFRPWIIVGALLIMLASWLLFQAEPGITSGYLFLALLLLYVGFSCMNLAQISWGSKLSPDYAERARIFGFWTAFNVIGTLSVLFIPPAVSQLWPAAPASAGIHAMGWYILCLAPLAAIVGAAIVPEGEAPPTDHRVTLADVRQVLADRRMIRLLAVDLLLAIAPGITGALLIFFFTAARGLPAPTASALLLPYFLAGLVAAPFWIRLAGSWGKHRATTLSAVWAGIALFSVLFSPQDNLPLLFAGMALAGAPYAAPGFLLRAMLADLNDAQSLDRWSASDARSDTTGLNFAILTATQKLGFAIPVGLTYPILAAIGFDARLGPGNSAEALMGLEILFIGPPVLFALLAAWLIWKWPITAEVHAQTRLRLSALQAGS